MYIVLISYKVKNIILRADDIRKGMVCIPRQIAAWYYMKLLRPWIGDKLFDINFEFK